MPQLFQLPDRSGPFGSAVRSLLRGHHHVNDFELCVKAFLNRQPWSHSFERNSNGKKVHTIRFTGRPPEILESIATDAAYNLRAALDQCSYAATQLISPTKSNRTHFPFGDAGKVGFNVKGLGCESVTPEILAVFREFEPYAGGNAPLFSLNCLCNTNKHRFIGTTDYYGGPDTVVHSEAALPIWDGEKQQIIFRHGTPESYSEAGVNFSMLIVFDGIAEVSGRPAIPILSGFCGVTHAIIDSAAMARRRLGKFKQPRQPLRLDPRKA